MKCEKFALLKNNLGYQAIGSLIVAKSFIVSRPGLNLKLEHFVTCSDIIIKESEAKTFIIKYKALLKLLPQKILPFEDSPKLFDTS